MAVNRIEDLVRLLSQRMSGAEQAPVHGGRMFPGGPGGRGRFPGGLLQPPTVTGMGEENPARPAGLLPQLEPSFDATFNTEPIMSPELERKPTQLDPTIGFGAFADGGIVNKPTISLLGEEGPEAVVPLKEGYSNYGPNTINPNTGMTSDGRTISSSTSGGVKPINSSADIYDILMRGRGTSTPTEEKSPLTRESALDENQTGVYDEAMEQILNNLQNIQISPLQQELVDLQAETARGVDPDVAEQRFRENELPRMQRILEESVLPGIRAEQIASGNFWSSGRADAVGDATEKFGEYTSSQLGRAIREGRESGQRAMPGAMDAAGLQRRTQYEALQQAFPWLQLPTELTYFDPKVPNISIGGSNRSFTVGLGGEPAGGGYQSDGIQEGKRDEGFDIQRLLEEIRRQQGGE